MSVTKDDRHPFWKKFVLHCLEYGITVDLKSDKGSAAWRDFLGGVGASGDYVRSFAVEARNTVNKQLKESRKK